MLPIALLMMVTMRMGQQWSDGILELFTAPWKPVYLDITVSMIVYLILFWVAVNLKCLIKNVYLMLRHSNNVKFSHIIEWL